MSASCGAEKYVMPISAGWHCHINFNAFAKVALRAQVPGATNWTCHTWGLLHVSRAMLGVRIVQVICRCRVYTWLRVVLHSSGQHFLSVTESSEADCGGRRGVGCHAATTSPRVCKNSRTWAVFCHTGSTFLTALF